MVGQAWLGGLAIPQSSGTTRLVHKQNVKIKS